jgi:hypothetical protein
MHKLIRITLCLMLPVLVACSLASAQDITPTPQQTDTVETSNEWFVYLYNSTTDALMRVGADGSQTMYSLGLEDVLASTYELSFNEDGTRVAFCKRDYNESTGIVAFTLIVRDIVSQTNLLEYDLGASTGKTCSLGRQGYVNDRIAVAVMNYSAFDTNPDTSQPMWQIMLIDVTTGALISQLDSSTNAVPYAGAYEGAQLPLIQHSTGTDIYFMFAPFGGDGPQSFPAFVWHTENGSIEAVEYWGLIGMSALDTGEIALPAYDPALPAGNTGGPMEIYNVVQVVGSDSTPRNIYQTADYLISRVQFINNGQQIAVLEYPSFEPGQPTDSIPPQHWIAIDRAGNVTELLTFDYMTEIQPAPNGYVAFEQTFLDEAFTQGHFVLSLVQDGVSTTLVELDTTDRAVWSLAWSMPSTSDTDLPPFPTLSQ